MSKLWTWAIAHGKDYTVRADSVHPSLIAYSNSENRASTDSQNGKASGTHCDVHTALRSIPE
jgi:hypothetical protein